MADLTVPVQNLCDDYERKLNDLHDDCEYTRMLWRDLQVRVERYGENPSVHNPITGSVTQGLALAGKGYVSLQRLRKRCFKDIVAQFELFFGDLLRIWLSANPLLMSEKALSLKALLDAQNLADARNAAVREAVESTIRKKIYDSPEKWFTYLKDNLGAQFTARDGLLFAEMKARRDIFEHNNGQVLAVYCEKAKSAAKYNVGDVIYLADEDVDAAYQLVLNLVKKISADAIAKSNAP